MKKRQIFVIGEPKSGKTLYAATASKDPKKVFFIAADPDGQESLDTYGFPCPREPLSAMDPYAGAVAVLESLAAKCPYDAVVIDDATTLQLGIKTWIQRERANEITSKSGIVDPRKVYGLLKNRMLDLLSRLRDLPCHVVWLAWAKEEVTSENGQVVKSGSAMLEGASGDIIEGACQAVILLRCAKIGVGNQFKREVRTDRYANYGLGNRMGLPDPFPYDLTVAAGRKPTWTHGLAQLLAWQVKPAAEGKQVVYAGRNA